MQYIRKRARVGSVSRPTYVNSALRTLNGEKVAVLIGKIAERLAFERSGIRLYEALKSKYNAADGGDRAATVQKFEPICAEELKHVHLLSHWLENLGADLTQTPSVDANSVTSEGVAKVLLDPRSTFTQCLEAILTAELIDCDAWKQLIELAESFDRTQMAEQFRAALATEKEHRVIIREYLAREIKSGSTAPSKPAIAN